MVFPVFTEPLKRILKFDSKIILGLGHNSFYHETGMQHI